MAKDTTKKDEGKLETPQLTPQQRRQQTVETNLGSTTGWVFVENVELPDGGKCQASGGRLKNGVKIYNKGLDKTLVVGKGIAKKYTDVEFPKATRAKATEDAVEPEAALEEIDMDALENALN